MVLTMIFSWITINSSFQKYSTSSLGLFMIAILKNLELFYDRYSSNIKYF